MNLEAVLLVFIIVESFVAIVLAILYVRVLNEKNVVVSKMSRYMAEVDKISNEMLKSRRGLRIVK